MRINKINSKKNSKKKHNEREKQNIYFCLQTWWKRKKKERYVKRTPQNRIELSFRSPNPILIEPKLSKKNQKNNPNIQPVWRKWLARTKVIQKQKVKVIKRIYSSGMEADHIAKTKNKKKTEQQENKWNEVSRQN